MGENYFGITDPGRQRTNNEDSFIAKTVAGNQLIIACVIDGVGGYEGGEVAARLTRDEIINHLGKLPGDIIERLVTALDNANERIIREKEVSPQNEKMACVVTLALVDIEKNIFYFAHVGDTRLYLFRDGSLIKVTRDHSAVGFLEESGRITEAAAMLHPKRNEVNKVLGYETQIALTKDFIDTGESPFLPGDTILLCSDGLTDMIPASKIISILSSEEDLPLKGKLLINAANDAGGKDNITVVLVQNDKPGLKHEMTKPQFAQIKNNNSGEEKMKMMEDGASHGKPVIKSNSSNKINKLLLLFCILFFLGFAYLLFKNYKENIIIEKHTQTVTPKKRNQQEINLSDSINASANAIVRLSGSQSILITEPVLIKNDSLHIIGNGVTVLRDSSFNGPAFMLAANCKYILLDSLTIENFNVGILVINKGLHLKKVRFKNCLAPLRFQPNIIQDTVVSGTQAETIFYYKDSLRR